MSTIVETCTACQMTLASYLASASPGLIAARAEDGEPQYCPVCGHLLMAVTADTGKLVGGWQLQGWVAKHSRATVYFATQKCDAAAVKVFTDYAAEHVARHHSEVMAHRLVNHPGVAHLLDSGLLANGCPYLISRWIRGGTLAARLRGGALPWRDVLVLATRLASALGAVHGAGVVHRDLKPSNVALDGGNVGNAVLLDFGHALVEGNRRATQSGMVVGSAPYMAPEQIRGELVDARSDIYALGVVLYQALVGHLPYAAPNASDMLLQHLRASVVAPALRRPDLAIPNELSDLCLWMLAKDRNARVPNAHVLSAMLAGMSCALPNRDTDHDTDHKRDQNRRDSERGVNPRLP